MPSMMSSPSFRRASLVLCALLFPAAAHAQLGGIMKRAKQKAAEVAADKAAQKAGAKAGAVDSSASSTPSTPSTTSATSASATSPAPAAAPRRGHAVAITPDLVDRAIRAADATAANNITQDSAAAVIFGQGSQRRWWQMRERITAFLLIDGDSPTGQCMKGERLQYVFDDDEIAALRARKSDLAKRFDTSADERMTVWGKCASSRGPRKEAKRKTAGE